MIFYTVVLLIFIQKYIIEKENNKNNLENENNSNKIYNENNEIIINNGNNIYNENFGNNENNEININNDNYGDKIVPFNQYQSKVDNLSAVKVIVQSYNSKRELSDQQVTNLKPNIDNEIDELETEDTARFLMNILLGAFIGCQVLYVVQLFVLSAFHQKSKTMEKLDNADICRFSNFTRVYRDLIIVGYIFFVILLIFYIILLIFYNKFGESQKNKLERLRFCKICDDCIIGGCKKCTEIFKTMTDEELRQFYDNEAKTLKGTNEEKDKYINDLKNYKNELNVYNNLLKRFETEDTSEEKMNELNLFPIILNKT